MRTRHPVRYLVKNISRSYKSIYDLCNWKTINVEGKSVNRYYGTTALLLSLGRCARSLLDYSLEKMNKDNVVINDRFFKREFNTVLIKMRGKGYSSGTINKAFGELVDSQLARRMKKRGAYKISPLFFFSGTEVKRDSQITSEYERPIKALANKVRRALYERDGGKNKKD